MSDDGKQIGKFHYDVQRPKRKPQHAPRGIESLLETQKAIAQHQFAIALANKKPKKKAFYCDEDFPTEQQIKEAEKDLEEAYNQQCIFDYEQERKGEVLDGSVPEDSKESGPDEEEGCPVCPPLEKVSSTKTERAAEDELPPLEPGSPPGRPDLPKPRCICAIKQPGCCSLNPIDVDTDKSDTDYASFPEMATNPKGQCRGWVFTLNNPNPHDPTVLLALPTKPKSGIRYIGFEEEAGKNGTRHLQGFAYCNNGKTLSGMKKLIPRAHFEKMRGTFLQNVQYCSKEGKFQHAGEPPTQGRTYPASSVTCDQMVTDLLNGASEKELLMKYRSVYLRMYRGVSHSMNLLKSPVAYSRVYQKKQVTNQTSPMSVPSTLFQVWVLFGSTGTGKSRFVQEFAEFHKMSMYKKDASTEKWWDGYLGEQILWMDDYRGNQMNLGSLLNLLDGFHYHTQVHSTH